MVIAEFEEREFETPLYNQLQQTTLTWSPGQVLEGHVGFDYAAFCHDPRVWAIHGIRAPFNGIVLDELSFLWHFRRPRDPRPLPNFELNLFIQAKRPTHLKRAAARLRQHGLNSPYWRINIDMEQQQLLESLEMQVRGRGLVCYAAPAFHRLSQLYSHIKNGTIVENSTFPEATTLANHSKWNYDRSGNTGVANADPEFIERPAINERLDSLVAEYAEASEGSYDENLATLARIATVCAEEAYRLQEARAAYFFQRRSAISAIFDTEREQISEAIHNFLIVHAFCEVFGIQWLAIGAK